MEPIVSPWFIYLLGVVDGVGVLGKIFAFMAGAVFLVSAICVIFEVWNDEKEERVQNGFQL